jgi:crotonobetainyl-CoA:carnitine CoA-transferase CaiB-like acyl-CoA transferase
MMIRHKEFKSDGSAPLSGVRVIDLSRLMAGNMLTLQLADFGAEVIKVEPPGVGDTLRHWTQDDVPVWWKVYSRNKKSVTLNTRSKTAPDILKSLIKDAHIFVESFRPGVLEAMGASPAELLAVNPKLVIVRITGWGQTGPYKDRPGFGTLVEAMSGFAEKNGFPDKPPALPNLGLADMVAGLYGFSAALIALREAEKPGGAGQVVDLSLLEPLLSILGPDAEIYRLTGRLPERTGNRTAIAAPRNAYRTKEGEWIALSASTQQMAFRLLEAIGRPELKNSPKFSTNECRIRNVDELDQIIGDFVKTKTLDENLNYLRSHHITVAPIYNIKQIMNDRHVLEREVLVEVSDKDLGGVYMHNVVPKLDRTPGTIRSPAPALGEHNQEIYQSTGMSAETIKEYSMNGII